MFLFGIHRRCWITTNLARLSCQHWYVMDFAVCGIGIFWEQKLPEKTPEELPAAAMPMHCHRCSGYIFVLNMIGVHAVILVAQGRFHSGVHKRPGYRNWPQRERYRCSDLTRNCRWSRIY